MSNFVPKKDVLRGSLITFFHLKKTAAESYRLLVEAYGQHAPTQKTCERWFARFKSGDFDTEDKERPGQPKKFKDEELKALLHEDCCQTQEELALSLGVTQQAISLRLKEAQMGIKNCLEIKMEDEIGDDDNNDEFPICEVILKIEDPEEGGSSIIHLNKFSTNNNENEPAQETSPIKDVLETSSKPDLKMCDSEDNKEDDRSDPYFPKTNKDDSVPSNDSDWQEAYTKLLAKKEVKTKRSIFKKAKKETNDYLPTPCDQCDGVFPKYQLLARHKRHAHVPEELKVQCPYCPNKFGRRLNMYAHIRTHHKAKPVEEHIK